MTHEFNPRDPRDPRDLAHSSLSTLIVSCKINILRKLLSAFQEIPNLEHFNELNEIQ